MSFYYWVVRGLYIFYMQVPYQIHDLQKFSFTLWMSFYSLYVIKAQKCLILMMSSLFFYFVDCFWYPILRRLCLTQGHEYIYLLYLMQLVVGQAIDFPNQVCGLLSIGINMNLSLILWLEICKLYFIHVACVKVSFLRLHNTSLNTPHFLYPFIHW